MMLNQDKLKNHNNMQESSWRMIKVGPRVDAHTFNSFKNTCEQLLQDGFKQLVLDFEGTQFVSMVGFQYIHQLFTRLSELNGDLLLMSTSEKLKRQALIYSHKDIKALFRSKSDLHFLTKS